MQVTNESHRPQKGIPVTLTVGATLPSLPLAGKDVKAIRVCDDQELELLCDLRHPKAHHAEMVLYKLATDFLFFVELPPKMTRNYFIYADNPQA